VFNLAQVYPDTSIRFAYALKHHLRHESGPFYQDLYPFLIALETSPYCQHWFQSNPNVPQLTRTLPIDGLPTHNGEYGTFPIVTTETAPLLPATPPDRSQVIAKVNTSLVPGVSFLQRLGRWLSRKSFT